MKKIIFSGAIALLALTSCSNEEPMMMPSANNNLRVYGMIQELKSRAGDTSFDANDAIGITVGDQVNVQYTTTDGTVFTSATPISITSEENVPLTAYYPYNANPEADGIINFNVTESGTHDYLFATTNVSTTNYTANLQFAHKMSKVAVTLDTDEGLLEDGARVTLSINAIADGSFNTSTGIVTAGTTKGNLSAGQVLASGGSGSFILPPSTSATDIKVSVVTSDAIYSGTVSTPLLAGHQHNYKLTLKSDGAAGIALEISIPANDPITDWINENEIEDDLEKEIPSLPENEIIEVGDYLLSNGATLDKAFDLNTIGSYQEGKEGVNAVAVVVYTSDLASNIYGLNSYSAIAMTVAQPGAKFANPEYYDENADDKGMMCLWWYDQSTKPEGAPQYPARQIPIKDGAFDVDGDWSGSFSGVKLVGNTDVAGLNNTNAWKAWITATSKEITNFPVINAVSNYNVTVEGINSGWFVPSFAEYTNFNDDNVIANLKASFMALGENEDQFDTGSAKGEWTSTEARYNYNKGNPRSEEVSFKIGSTSPAQTSGAGTTLPYRFAIAF